MAAFVGLFATTALLNPRTRRQRKYAPARLRTRMRAPAPSRDSLAVAPCLINAWWYQWQNGPWPQCVDTLTPTQYDMLASWVLRRPPLAAKGRLAPRAREYCSNRTSEEWTGVGSLRSIPESGALGDIVVGALQCRPHCVTPNRYDYRANIKGAWIHLGDDEAAREGLRHLRNGEIVTVFGFTWHVILDPAFRRN